MHNRVYFRGTGGAFTRLPGSICLPPLAIGFPYILYGIAPPPWICVYPLFKFAAMCLPLLNQIVK